MGVPDDLYHWYLLPTGWVSGDPAAPAPGALVHLVFASPNNNPYSKAYWKFPTELVADKEAIRAAMKRFGSHPERHY